MSQSIIEPQTQEVISFAKPIKFVKYGFDFFIIITKNNKIYYFNRDIKQLQYLKSLNLGIIKHVECNDKFTILVNHKNEFYKLLILFNNDYKINKLSLDIINNFKFIRLSNNTETDYNLIIVTTADFIYYFNKKNTLIAINNNFTELKIKDIQYSKNHGLLLDDLGSIYGIGENLDSQLGLKDTDYKTEFTFIPLPFKVAKIHCGNGHSLILNEHNEIYGTGYNSCDALGLGEEFAESFTKINIDNLGNDEIVGFCKTYYDYNIIFTKQNDLYVCGRNYDNMFQIDKSFCKKYYICDSKQHYLNHFRKLDYFKTNKKFVFPILFFYKLFIVTSNYEMNVEKEAYNNDLEDLLLQKAFNLQLVDVQFCFIN